MTQRGQGIGDEGGKGNDCIASKIPLCSLWDHAIGFHQSELASSSSKTNLDQILELWEIVC